MSDELWIGVDLGGTKILGGLFDRDFKRLARAKEPTPPPAHGPSAVFAAIDRVVEKVLSDAKAQRSHIRGMGFGIPGQIDPVHRKVKFAPNLEWHNVELNALTPKDWTWPTWKGTATTTFTSPVLRFILAMPAGPAPMLRGPKVASILESAGRCFAASSRFTRK